ncbi:hypothetical protein [Streptomyces sp. Wh19]|uniref:hypothetical protein n=1 Tax=Streptomyces sp. Wh19 TaxID=3076629 RepID=UPI002958D37B|nr:hypothetical protein [Streptomyces sp. Wh19]MDV9195533.1 hypothetical protein [Streptomyces sp. Wh19]
MASTKILTADTILTRYAADIAFVAEEDAPATTIPDFTNHLRIAAEHLEMAGFTSAEEAEIVAQYLDDAHDSTDSAEQVVFMKRATERIGFVGDMADEYRDMC